MSMSYAVKAINICISAGSSIWLPKGGLEVDKRGITRLPLSLKSETPPPFCYSRRPVSHVPQASLLGRTPLGFAAVGTQGEQFVGRAEPAVTIVQRAHLVTNLLAFEDGMAVLTAQQVRALVSRLTMWANRRQ